MASDNDNKLRETSATDLGLGSEERIEDLKNQSANFARSSFLGYENDFNVPNVYGPLVSSEIAAQNAVIVARQAQRGVAVEVPRSAELPQLLEELEHVIDPENLVFDEDIAQDPSVYNSLLLSGKNYSSIGRRKVLVDEVLYGGEKLSTIQDSFRRLQKRFWSKNANNELVYLNDGENFPNESSLPYKILTVREEGVTEREAERLVRKATIFIEANDMEEYMGIPTVDTVERNFVARDYAQPSKVVEAKLLSREIQANPLLDAINVASETNLNKRRDLVGSNPANFADTFVDDFNENSNKPIFLEELWEQFLLQNIDLETVFFDHCTDMMLPISNNVLEATNTVGKTMYHDFNSLYNFYIGIYEKYSPLVAEKWLPNMYFFIFSNDQRRLVDFLTLEQMMDPIQTQVWYERAQAPDTNQNQVMENSPYGNYHYQWSDTIRNADAALAQLNALDEENQLFSKIGIPLDSFRILDDYFSKRYVFPFGIEYIFSTDTLVQLADAIRDTHYDRKFLKEFMWDIPDSSRDFREAITTYAVNTTTDYTVNASFVRNHTQTLKEWGLWKLLDKFEQQHRQVGIVLGNDEPEYSSLEKALLKFVLNRKIIKILRNTKREFWQILNGDLAHSETILYRVDKKNHETGEFIQSIYFSNSSDVEEYKYFDTQIKYGTAAHYDYECSAYQFIVGTQYKYDSISVDGRYAEIKVTYNPSAKIIETPYFFREDESVYDAPPMFPNVQIIPYLDVNNKILVTLNGSAGSIVEAPILIEEQDGQKFASFTRVSIPKNTIRFATDDHPRAFEVFLLSEPPNSYKDFTGNKLATVSTGNASSAALNIEVVANQKYYMICRSIDVHNHLSNPTYVFQFELIDDNNAIYLVVNHYEFGKENTKEKNKPLRKYIAIRPNLSQRIVNEEASGITNSVRDTETIHLGIADESVWGKKFKMRVTSKHTNKKIDFDFTFNTTYNKLPEETN